MSVFLKEEHCKAMLRFISGHRDFFKSPSKPLPHHIHRFKHQDIMQEKSYQLYLNSRELLEDINRQGTPNLASIHDRTAQISPLLGKYQQLSGNPLWAEHASLCWKE